MRILSYSNSNDTTTEGHTVKTKTKTKKRPVVTDEQAEMLAQHAIFVQGGFSTAEVEKERAEKQLAEHPGSIDFDRMAKEVRDELDSRVAGITASTAPITPISEQRVDVTAALPDIDSAIALRKRIKALQTDLKAHEQSIKDVLGNATEGVDSTGKVVVTYPTRNRTNLVAAKVKAILTEKQYADCQNVTSYRPLIFDGE